MSEYKKEFRYFTIFDYEKEQEYLSWMHECGWKFTMVYFPGIYCFEKCKPEKVIYQLDYNQEGRTHKAEYLQMFADCGWEYLLEFMGYSYFRKPAAEMKEDEGIFCDDDSRLDMMKRVFRGRMVPLLCIFLAVLLPQLLIPVLLFVFGVSIGANRELIANLGRFGWQAVVLACLGLAGSLLAGYVAGRLLEKKGGRHEI